MKRLLCPLWELFPQMKILILYYDSSLYYPLSLCLLCHRLPVTNPLQVLRAQKLRSFQGKVSSTQDGE